MIKEEAIAVVTLKDGDTMNKKQRSKIATWLRRQATVFENEGGKGGKIAKRYRARYLVGVVSSLLLCLLLSGCVTKYDDIVSEWHTVQNGPICTTMATDQRKFNAETAEPRAIECPCSQLITVKRLAVKAGESPEAWSCPAPVHIAMNNSIMIESRSLHHRASLASTYIPAASDLLGNVALGALIRIGLNSVRMTQSVGGLNINETFSTKYIGK